MRMAMTCFSRIYPGYNTAFNFTNPFNYLVRNSNQCQQQVYQNTAFPLSEKLGCFRSLVWSIFPALHHNSSTVNKSGSRVSCELSQYPKSNLSTLRDLNFFFKVETLCLMFFPPIQGFNFSFGDVCSTLSNLKNQSP